MTSLATDHLCRQRTSVQELHQQYHPRLPLFLHEIMEKYAIFDKSDLFKHTSSCMGQTLIRLYADSSDYIRKTDRVRFQTVKIRRRQLIGFWCHRLPTTEFNCAISEKELVALVYIIAICLNYLSCEDYDVYINYACLSLLIRIFDLTTWLCGCQCR